MGEQLHLTRTNEQEDSRMSRMYKTGAGESEASQKCGAGWQYS